MIIRAISRVFDSPRSVKYTFIEPRISTGIVQKSDMMIRIRGCVSPNSLTVVECQVLAILYIDNADKRPN
jgi:hypothetical protein